MSKRYILKNGKVVRTVEDGESYILKDGESLGGGSFMLMDSVQHSVSQNTVQVFDAIGHKPGFVGVSMGDADHLARAQRYTERKAKLADAWKDAPPLPHGALADAGSANAIDDARRAFASSHGQDGRDAAYQARNRRLEDAWKGGAV